MKKFILGSGLAGLLAKYIHPSYTIIPFKKSRFYSIRQPIGNASIPIGDNNIVCHDKVAPIISDMRLDTTPIFFPTAISYNGSLNFNKNLWVSKIVNRLYDRDDFHPFAGNLISDDLFCYNASAIQVYDLLMRKFRRHILNNIETDIKFINEEDMVLSDGQAIKYDSIISTIPFDALLTLLDLDCNLSSSLTHVVLLATKSFNLEGAKRCYIADDPIPFWKVNVINDVIYQFYANEEVDNLNKIFGLLTKGAHKIIADTVIKNAFPLGAPPFDALNHLSQKNIHCIGAHARWDYFYDISTSIINLQNIE